jgi:hypothetical protein
VSQWEDLEALEGAVAMLVVQVAVKLVVQVVAKLVVHVVAKLVAQVVAKLVVQVVAKMVVKVVAFPKCPTVREARPLRRRKLR